MINKELENAKYRIWYRQYDANGNIIGEGCYHKEYVTYGHAYNRARTLYGDKEGVIFEVAKRNPWADYTCMHVCDLCGYRFNVKENCDGYSFAGSISIGSIYGKNKEYPYIGIRSICLECRDKVVTFIDSLKKKEKIGEYF